jgi:hypothetical protein
LILGFYYIAKEIVTPILHNSILFHYRVVCYKSLPHQIRRVFERWSVQKPEVSGRSAFREAKLESPDATLPTHPGQGVTSNGGFAYFRTGMEYKALSRGFQRRKPGCTALSYFAVLES